ncbi:glucose-1-phosphate adenylyltransferase subunit GlgD [Chloroflexota bacterium]
MKKVLAIIMAGGRGERLSLLAQERAKPAIPFAGKYRIIDFTLSNCVNSGIYDVSVLTQYQPLSIADHVGIGAEWGLATRDRAIRLLQPYLARDEGRDWYKGTADAVYQNFEFIEEQDAELVLILSADHVYKMDYSKMLKVLEDTEADVVLGITRIPDEELHRFGTVILDIEGRVISFHEKVKKPKSNFVSMGVYLFKKDILRRCLEEDAQNMVSKHDFGRDILPRKVDSDKICTCYFDGYWRDVGTVYSYWQANMDLLERSPSLLFSADWPIHTKEEERPPAIISQTGNIINGLISDGCVIEGQVEHSILSPGVKVAEGAVIKDSIIMSDSVVGVRSVVDYSILDKGVIVEADCYLGFGDDFQSNRKEVNTLNSGITVVGKRVTVPAGVKVGRNCAIYGGATGSDFRTSAIQSGETIKPKRRSAARKA